MTQPHNFKPGLMTIRDSQKLNELQKWIDNRRVALAIPANAFPPSYKFQAKITAYSSDDYSWTRQAFDVDGEYIDDPVPYSGGLSDMPAKERNGKVAVDFPFYAELTFRVNVQGSPYYEFDYTTVDRITIKEVDGSPSVLAKTLELPNSAMSNPSTGVARLLEASSTTGGTVTLTTQTMGDGEKTFQDGVIVNSQQSTNANAFTVKPVSGGTLLGTAFNVFVDTLANGTHVTIGAPDGGDLTVYGPFSFLTYGTITGDSSGVASQMQFYGSNDWTIGSFLEDYKYGTTLENYVFTDQLSLVFSNQNCLMLTKGATSGSTSYGVVSGGVAYEGVTGAMGPGASATGGVITNAGSGSFFDGNAANLTGTLDGGSF